MIIYLKSLYFYELISAILNGSGINWDFLISLLTIPIAVSKLFYNQSNIDVFSIIFIIIPHNYPLLKIL